MKSDQSIRITWLGHACFQVTCEGYTILLDPYTDNYVPGLAPLEAKANQVLCSHGHADHNAVDVIAVEEKDGSPFHITEISTYHDDQAGALRGINTIRVIDNGALRIAHLGDLGCELTPDQKAQLAGLDAVMVPVGGYYTIDAKQAEKLMKEISPKVIIPMHYRSERFGYDVLGTLDAFTDLFDVVVEYPGNTLELTADTEPHVAILQYE